MPPVRSNTSPAAVVIGVIGGLLLVIGAIVYWSDPYYNNTTDPVATTVTFIGLGVLAIAGIVQAAWTRAGRAKAAASGYTLQGYRKGAAPASRAWWDAPPRPGFERTPPPIPAETMTALDPALTAGELAKVAAERSDLWDAVASHPNSYQDLRTWIADRRAAERTQEHDGAPAAEVTPDSVPISITVVEDDKTADARRRAADPAMTHVDLADIAHRYPGLRSVVAENPSCYPALRDWIASAGKS
ncbi:MAG: hypothetical protein ABI435_00405 [Pseudolysinimonas sp.]